MPCKGDPGPDSPETQSHKIAKHLCYLWTAMGMASIPKEFQQAADSCFGNAKYFDDWTRLLCALCKAFGKEAQDRLIYDGRNPQARALADWLDRHKVFDQQRAM